MATQKTVSKLADKIIKISENYTVYRYDNGYMFEAGGRNKKGDYIVAKILCNSLDEVVALVREAAEMDLDV